MLDKNLLRVKIDCEHHFLNSSEIKYSIKCILNITGIPWLFTKGDSCDIYYGNDSSFNSKLIILPSIRKDIDSLKLFTYEGLDYLSDKPSNFLAKNKNTLLIQNDIILSTFLFLTDYFYNSNSESKDSLLFFDKNNSFHKPVVNSYGLLIRKLFEKTHKFLPIWPNNKKFALAVTHDVDHPEIHRVYDSIRFFKRLNSQMKRDLKSKESFWKFRDWINLEASLGLKSAFYFCPRKGNVLDYILFRLGFNRPPDPIYDIKDEKYKEVINLIKSSGFEVGLHASYNSHFSSKNFSSEKEKLEFVAKDKVFGVRHHYWNLGSRKYQTFLFHQTAGLKYDCSLAFPTNTGFRNLISTPFKLYSKDKSRELKLWELPTSFMDDHLFGYFKENGNSKQYEIDSLVKSVVDSEGILCIDFHVRVLNENFFPGWKEMFIKIMDKVNSFGDYYVDTPNNIIQHCIERERKINNNTK